MIGTVWRFACFRKNRSGSFDALQKTMLEFVNTKLRISNTQNSSIANKRNPPRISLPRLFSKISCSWSIPKSTLWRRVRSLFFSFPQACPSPFPVPSPSCVSAHASRRRCRRPTNRRPAPQLHAAALSVSRRRIRGWSARSGLLTGPAATQRRHAPRPGACAIHRARHKQNGRENCTDDWRCSWWICRYRKSRRINENTYLVGNTSIAVFRIDIDFSCLLISTQ